MQFPIGSPLSPVGLPPLARALLLSLCVHVALLGAVWQFSSNRQQQPMQRMLNVELAPHANVAVAPAIAPQTPGEMPRNAPARRIKASSERLVRAPTNVPAPQPSSTERADATPSDAAEYAPSTPAPALAQEAPTIDLRVLDWLAQYRSYPLAARRAHIEGVVQLRVMLMPDGTLVGARIERGSGHAILDRAALELLSRAARLPDSFGHARSGEIELQLPIVYRMRT